MFWGAKWPDWCGLAGRLFALSLCVCTCACLPAHSHCAVDDVVYFFSLNTTAESSFCRGGCHYQLSS